MLLSLYVAYTNKIEYTTDNEHYEDCHTCHVVIMRVLQKVNKYPTCNDIKPDKIDDK